MSPYIEEGEGGACHSHRFASAFVDTDPTVEVGAIVEMDPVSKYPKASLIRGRESMQTIAIGRSVVASHCCTGRSWGLVARCN